MAQLDQALSIMGKAIRITRLTAAGNPVVGTDASYVTKAFSSVSFTPNYEEGQQIQVTNASGGKCLSYRLPDTLENVSLELSVCAPGPELTEILTGGSILSKTINSAETSVGFGLNKIGATAREDGSSGVSIEVWSAAAEGDHDAYTHPYWRWVFPKAEIRPSGSRVIESENALANTYEGTVVGNINFGTGPDGKWEWPSDTDRPVLWSRVEESDLPTGEGLVAVTAPSLPTP